MKLFEQIKQTIIDDNDNRYVMTYCSKTIKIELYDIFTKSLVDISNDLNKLNPSLLMKFKAAFWDQKNIHE